MNKNKRKNWHNTVESTKQNKNRVLSLESLKTRNKTKKEATILCLFMMMLEVIPRTMGKI